MNMQIVVHEPVVSRRLRSESCNPALKLAQPEIHGQGQEAAGRQNKLEEDAFQKWCEGKGRENLIYV